jgi:WD40 repeat protein
VAIVPDGRRAISVGKDKAVILWDVKTGKEIGRLEGTAADTWSAAFSPDGKKSSRAATVRRF